MTTKITSTGGAEWEIEPRAEDEVSIAQIQRLGWPYFKRVFKRADLLAALGVDEAEAKLAAVRDVRDNLLKNARALREDCGGREYQMAADALSLILDPKPALPVKPGSVIVADFKIAAGKSYFGIPMTRHRNGTWWSLDGNLILADETQITTWRGAKVAE